VTLVSGVKTEVERQAVVEIVVQLDREEVLVHVSARHDGNGEGISGNRARKQAKAPTFGFLVVVARGFLV